MESIEQKQEANSQVEQVHPASKPNVHAILAHSYSFYFLSLIVGVILDFIYPVQVSHTEFWQILGSVLVILGSLLVFWAQNTSRNLKVDEKEHDKAVSQFKKGPYRFVRGPTHYGLGFLILGFGLMSNMPFIVLTTVISFFITKMIFLKREENLLAQKYGAPYLEYKKAVRF